LIARGAAYLQRASTGSKLSRYHLEASIAYWHTIKEDSAEKWENILNLYNYRLALEYSPIAALNRTYALAKVKGKEAALVEAEKLKHENNRFYFLLLGELYAGVNNHRALAYLHKAQSMTNTEAEKVIVDKMISKLELNLSL
jgi:predicted RNA polymerase sigma factor